MEIKRDQYLNRLINRMHNGFIKVITGIRRSGKSYLMNTIFYDHLISSGVNEDHIILFAFDSAEDLIKIGEDPLKFDNDHANEKVDPKKFLLYINDQIKDKDDYYLLLDEVQNLGAFEAVLNGFLRKHNLDVYVTGSNSKFLSKDILTEFEGRGDEIHVLPLSFSEFAAFYSGTSEEAFDEYMIYGGLPAVALMKTDEQKSNYLITQLTNIYLKDIINRYNLQSDKAISDLLDVVASGISSLTNPRKLSAAFASVKQEKISPNTVDKYIEHMEEAFMLTRVKRYDCYAAN